MRSFEESLFVIRELKSTVDEFKCGTFCKDEKFFRKVVEVRTSVLEWAHDIVYIMREKQFKGYEDIDFSFDLSLPKDLDNFKLRDFQVEVFQPVIIILNELEFTPAKEIELKPEDAGKQMEFLGKIIVDFSVAIEILKGHYGITDNFDIMKIKI